MIIRIIWKHVITMWTWRNNTLHGPTKQSNWHRQQLHDQVRTLYATKTQMDQDDQIPLATPINDILRMNNDQIAKWIFRITPRIRQALQRTKRRTQERSLPIQAYFQPDSTLRAAKQALHGRLRKQTPSHKQHKSSSKKQKTTTDIASPTPQQTQNNKNQKKRQRTDTQITQYFNVKRPKDDLRPP